MTRSDVIPKKVTVLIPCLNEAKGIAKVIKGFPRDELAKQDLALHVLVIDNNSTDNTTAVAQKAGAQVVHEPNRGKGNAVRAGLRHIPEDTDYVVMLDGDNTYHPKEILRMLEPLRSNFCDAVMGSRLGGNIQNTAMTRLNLFGNRAFTAAARWLYGINITDTLTGYFAWRKATLDELAPYIESPGFALEMEMVAKMARLNHRVISVPISYQPRAGRAHLNPFKDGLRILAVALRYLLWRPLPAGQLIFRPRKIVFVSDAIYPYMKGGKEKRLHEITKHLAAMGHDVHIYTMKWWSGPRKNRVEAGVHLHALCKQHTMYRGDRRSIKEAVLFGLACFKLIRVKFDVLDVDHMPFFPIFSAWVVCLLRGRKLYATWHETLSRQEWVGYMRGGGLVASIIERLSIKLPHYITAASAQTKESLASIHGRHRRVALVASGIDTTLLSNVPVAPIDCDVLYVGRLVKDKNVDKLVFAIDIVAQTHPHIQCVVIGQGPEKSRLQSEIEQRGLQSNITLLDHLPDATDVYAYMKAAKVFCTPSVREGFGITTLEALGCGTPVITVNSPSNAARHLIQDGHNGSVVQLTPQAIAQAITQWTTIEHKPDTAPEVASSDWQKLAQQQAEVYMS